MKSVDFLFKEKEYTGMATVTVGDKEKYGDDYWVKRAIPFVEGGR